MTFQQDSPRTPHGKTHVNVKPIPAGVFHRPVRRPNLRALGAAIFAIGIGLFSGDVKTEPNTTKATPLARQKTAELSQDWKVCAELSNSNAKILEFRSWVLVSGLRCSRRIPSSTQAQAQIVKLKKWIEQDTNWLTQTSSKKWVTDEYLRTWLFILEQKTWRQWAQTHFFGFARFLDRFESELDSNLKEKVFLASANWLKTGSENGELGFLQRFQKNKQKVRIVQLLEKAQAKKNEKFEVEKNLTPGEEQGLATNKLLRSSEEDSMYQRWFAAVNRNDELSVFVEGIEYLRTYTMGSYAKTIIEKLSDLYPEVTAPSRVADVLARLDQTRWADLLRSTFRRGAYSNVTYLWESRASPLANSKEYPRHAILASRAMLIIGKYKKALEILLPFDQEFSNAEEAIEAKFLRGLALIRLHNYEAAVVEFESLLDRPEAEKFIVPAYYWCIRSMETLKSNRLSQFTSDFLKKFPYTYYSLRLNSEKNQGALKFESAQSFDRTDSFFDEVQWRLDRKQHIETLLASGWVGEAFAEVKSLTLPPGSDLWVQRIARFGLLPVAIRGFQDLPEENRTLNSLKILFPKDFRPSEIQMAATSYRVAKPYILGLIRQESAFDPWATSSSNAMGLMQMIPPTALEVAAQLGLRNFDPNPDLYNPSLNIRMGTYYFAKLLARFDNYTPYAIAAYNAGPERVAQFLAAKGPGSPLNSNSRDPWDDLWMDEFPLSETSFYVKAVLRNAILFRFFAGQNQWPNPLWSGITP